MKEGAGGSRGSRTICIEQAAPSCDRNANVKELAKYRKTRNPGLRSARICPSRASARGASVSDARVSGDREREGVTHRQKSRRDPVPSTSSPETKRNGSPPTPNLILLPGAKRSRNGGFLAAVRVLCNKEDEKKQTSRIEDFVRGPSDASARSQSAFFTLSDTLESRISCAGDDLIPE